MVCAVGIDVEGLLHDCIEARRFLSWALADLSPAVWSSSSFAARSTPLKAHSTAGGPYIYHVSVLGPFCALNMHLPGGEHIRQLGDKDRGR